MTMHPLTSHEIPQFNLRKYCNHGGLPMIYDSDEHWLDLRDYCSLYLKEEIRAEAIVRNVDHFAKFLDVMGQASGQELNYQKVASDSGVPVRTVANFVEILTDTLISYEVLPYNRTKKRKAVSRSKVYLFDVGVANYLAGRKSLLERTPEFGIAFEHFLMQEIRAYIQYQQLDTPMQYWRTLSGTYEVDLVLGQDIAIEMKSSQKFQEDMLKGLLAINEEQKWKRLICVTLDPVQKRIGPIEVLPYQKFLKLLWAGDLI
jgi:predicted AAA+ superfamily ATPase